MNADKLAEAKHRIRNLFTLAAVDGSACGAAQHEVEEIFTALAEHDAQPTQPAVTVTDEMVQRFLGWKLPDTFAPDCYVSFDREGIKKMGNGSHWPTGTNLLNDPEARAMLEHVLAASPQSAPGAENGLVDGLTAAMREADETFQRVGGSTRHYVRDCLLPILWMHGITVTAAPQPPVQPSDADKWKVETIGGPPLRFEQPSADAVSIAAEISTRPEFAKYEAPLILDIVRETLKAARASEHEGCKPLHQITENDVRRIVREELARVARPLE